MRQRALQRINLRQAHDRLSNFSGPVHLVAPHLREPDLSLGHALYAPSLLYSPLEFLFSRRSAQYHGVQVGQLSIPLSLQDGETGGYLKELGVEAVSAAGALQVGVILV